MAGGEAGGGAKPPAVVCPCYSRIVRHQIRYSKRLLRESFLLRITVESELQLQSVLIVDEVNGSFGQNTSEIVLGMILQVLKALLPAVKSPSPEPV